VASICSKCGNTSNPPGARNCSVCGALLSAGGVPTPAMLVSPGGRRYRLSPGGETLIGSQGCAILLSEPGVAPKHGRILPSGRGYAIESLGGSVKVNGMPITNPAPLQPGDTVTIGMAQLVYQGTAALPPARPAPVVAPPPKVVLPPVMPPPAAVVPATPAAVAAKPPKPVKTPPKAAIAVASPTRGVLADGEVVIADPERQDAPPFDAGRVLVMLSVVLVILGALVVGIAASAAIWIILLIFGLGSVGCMLPMMFPLVFAAFRPLLGWLGGRQTVSILNFQVLDSVSGMPVDIMLIRKRGGGGNVRLGDKVRVWGKRQANTGLIHAHKVNVYESGGHPANFGLEGHRPWPLWVGLLVLGLTVAALVAAASSVFGS